MKKTLIIITVALGVVASGLSQGFTTCSGGGNAATRVSTNSTAGGPAVGSTANISGLYYYALFASTQASGLSATAATGTTGTYIFGNIGTNPGNSWELVGFGTNIASAGRYVPATQGNSDAGQGALNADSSLTVQGIAGGNTADLIAIGWSANIGNTVAAVQAWYANPTFTGYIGQSSMASDVLGDGNLVPTPQVWNAAPTFLLGVVPVPEPGTMALAALSGASLLLFRRRK
jgi:hypothetical protein